MPRTTRQPRRSCGATPAAASRMNCTHTACGHAPAARARSSRAQAARILPLEVFGTVCGGASTMSSTGEPIRLSARSLILRFTSSWWTRPPGASRRAPRCARCRSPRRASRTPRAAAPHAGDIADRFFQLVGADVAAAADDDVLLAPGEVQHAVVEIGAVAGVQPFAVEELARGLGVAVIAARRRRPRNCSAPSERSGSSRPAASTTRISWSGIARPQATTLSGAGSSSRAAPPRRCARTARGRACPSATACRAA